MRYLRLMESQREASRSCLNVQDFFVAGNTVNRINRKLVAIKSLEAFSL